MLDIKFVREHPQVVKEDLKRRSMEEKVTSVDELLANDVKWRSLQSEANVLRGKRNKITDQIAQARKKGEDSSSLMKEAEDIPSQIRRVETQTTELEERVTKTLMSLPNIMHETVPLGKNEDDNQEVRKWGNPQKLQFIAKDHIDLAGGLGLIDMERAAKVAGSRFYYLRGDLVTLNYALIRLALDFLENKGYSLCQPPYLLHRDAVGGAVALSDFEDVIYKVEGEDLYLLATSEHALLVQHMNEILDGKSLPLRYAGVSPCFRKEAGAHGRDTKGIFRTHQFEKVEQFVFCRPEESWSEHEKLIAAAEEFVQTLKIPYRIVNVCAGDLGAVAAKKYDLEAWLPGQGKYREIISCSNCTSYQAVRSKVRFRDKPDEPTKWVHTLNSTLVATERTLVAIIENYQNQDGSIGVPETLQFYMRGVRRIRPANSR